MHGVGEVLAWEDAGVVDDFGTGGREVALHEGAGALYGAGELLALGGGVLVLLAEGWNGGSALVRE